MLEVFKNIISIISLTILLPYSLFTALHDPYIESIFKPIEEQKSLYFYRTLIFIMMFAPANFVILSIKNTLIVVILLLVINAILLCIKKKNTILEGICIELGVTLFLLIINSASAIKIEYKTLIISIAGSLINVVLLVMFVPQVLKDDSVIYFLSNKNEKFYVYTRPDDNIVLCGDKEHIEDATFVITISFEELKEKTLFVTKEDIMNKNKRKELIYNDQKRKKKKKITKWSWSSYHYTFNDSNSKNKQKRKEQ